MRKPYSVDVPVSSERLISRDEVAKIMGISTRTLDRRRSTGKLIHPTESEGNPRWRLRAVEDWIAAGCPPPSET